MEIWQPDLWSESDFNKVCITNVVFSFTDILYKCNYHDDDDNDEDDDDDDDHDHDHDSVDHTQSCILMAFLFSQHTRTYLIIS